MTKRFLKGLGPALLCAAALLFGLTGCSTDSGPGPELKSSDATLKSLTVSEGTLSPAFAPGTTEYALAVESGTTSVTVTGVANHGGAAVSGGGEKTLVAGKNTVTLVVTAEDGSTGVYTVAVDLSGGTLVLTTVDLLDLSALVAAPVKDASTAGTLIETAQYTGTLEWWQVRDGPGFSNFSGPSFAAGMVYRALVSLSPKTGYTFIGTTADSFTHSGAAVLSNAVDSGMVTITFKPTETGDGSYAFATPAQYRELVPVNTSDLVITGSGTTGVFISGRTVTLTPYNIAKYETTWELWKEVYDWATDADARGANVYAFANPGTEGHGTTNGTGIDPDVTKRGTRPVASINWRDAVVWCNAYSEVNSLTPVYYTDSVYGTALRTSVDTAVTPVITNDANGDRLPTEAQWEAAARGGSPSDTTNWAYTYAGGDTIDAVAWYQVNAGTGVGTGSPEYGVHPVGQKTANLLNLYDMSGNVQEYVWDRYGTISGSETITDPTGPDTGVNRTVKGGKHDVAAATCTVVTRSSVALTNRLTSSGFRLAQCGE
jgi:formylglycine-generating enzyme required for sulfatase activity